MKRTLMAIIAGTFFGTSTLSAETVNFDNDKVGTLPTGWVAGVTGSGTPKWSVQADDTAPSKPNVLMQSGSGTYPWCVKKDTSILDGFVEVKFKPISGQEDQAGGVVWRWKDGNNYYIARANALENNVTLFYVADGKRLTLKSATVTVPSKQWETIKAEFSGENIIVFLNGVKHIDFKDKHISGAGAVGVWTKADSVTAFDDFSYEGK